MTKAKTNSQSTILKLTDLGLIDENVSESYIQRYKELKQLHNEQVREIKRLKVKYPNVEITASL